jgi:hypothetical protein
MGRSRRQRWAALVVALTVPAFAAALSVDLVASSQTPLPLFDLTQNGKVHSELYRLERGEAPLDAAARATGADPVVDAGADPGHVTVSAVPRSDGTSLLADLQQLGLQDGLAIENLVTGRLPVDAIAAAGELDSLRFIRPEWSVSATGGVASQGDAAMKSDAARTALSVTGSGVTVGTLSDSFDCKSGYAADKAAGELPDGIEVLAEGPCANADLPPLDEGRAMMQIVSDVAPGATQKFHTARNGQLDYAQGIVDLKAAGAKVINDDYAYLTEPWFHDGVIAQAIDTVTADGVSYFTAAGNDGPASYESAYREGSYQPKGFAAVPAHDFDPGAGTDAAQRIKVPPLSIVRLALQWDDNFKTQILTADAPKSDLDIGAFTADGLLLPLPGVPGTENGLSSIPSGLVQSTTLEPVEVMLLLNLSTEEQPADLVIIRDSGPPPPLLKWIGVSIEPVKVEEFPATGTGTIFGHSQALGAMAVGAASVLQTSTPPVLEPYSSFGGGRITRNAKGEELGSAVVRERPNFVGPDDVNTSFFGEDSTGDADTSPNFPGTSAAAPHVAGVAALALEKAPTATRDDICNALSSTAVDMGTAGQDNASGHGFIDANAALAALPQSATATKSPRCSTVQIAVGAVSAKEGNTGTTKYTFKVTKLGATTQQVGVAYATADGTAKKGEDYTETTGTLTFAPADVTKTVDVEVTGDATIEPDETFDLTLANAMPANVVILGNTFGTATIDDDDDPTSPTGTAVEGALNYVTWGKASKSKAEPGDEVGIAGTGFKIDDTIALSFHSTPVSLGSATANATGGFTSSITIPSSATNGAHEIHAVGTDARGGTRTIRYPITIVNGASPTTTGITGAGTGTGTSGLVVQGSVTSTSVLPSTVAATPSTLPTTGGNIAFLAQLGSLLVLIGLSAIYGTRRRRDVACRR